MSSTLLQVIGLGLDIIGVAFMAWDIIFYDEEKIGTWGGIMDKSEKRKAKRNTLIGLGLIALGFALQIVAAFL